MFLWTLSIESGGDSGSSPLRRVGTGITCGIRNDVWNPDAVEEPE